MHTHTHTTEWSRKTEKGKGEKRDKARVRKVVRGWMWCSHYSWTSLLQPLMGQTFLAVIQRWLLYRGASVFTSLGTWTRWLKWWGGCLIEWLLYWSFTVHGFHKEFTCYMLHNQSLVASVIQCCKYFQLNCYCRHGLRRLEGNFTAHKLKASVSMVECKWQPFHVSG